MANRTEKSRRKKFRRLLTAILVFLIAVTGLEAGLRRAGFGVSTRPFLPCAPGGEKAFRINPDFYGRFFPLYTELMVDWDEFEFLVPAQKDPGVYRIFVFGGSVSHGDPDPARSFPHILAFLLREVFPETEVEVYNCAFPAANSHLMLPLARACAALDPDLFLVYMGNNEFAGPFNRLMDAPGYRVAPRFLIQAAIRLSNFRILQLAHQAGNAILSRLGPDRRPDEIDFSPRPIEPANRPAFYRAYRANLEGILRAGESAGAETVVCSLAGNLRHWRPENLPVEKNPVLREILDHARDLIADKQWEQARDLLENNRPADDMPAEFAFSLAQAYWALEESGKAAAAFEAAAAADRRHWRVDPAINRLARELAGSSGDSVFFADTAAALKKASPHGVPGIEFFFDSCHLNYEGNAILAREMFHTITAHAKAFRGRKPAAVPPPDRCREAFAVSPQQEAFLFLSEVRNTYVEYFLDLEADPMVPSPGSRTAAMLADCAAALPMGETYHRALAVYPENRRVHMECIKRLIEAGAYDAAIGESRLFRKRHPFTPAAGRLSGHALLESGRAAEAVEVLRENTARYPFAPRGRLLLSAALEARGETAEAESLAREIHGNISYLLSGLEMPGLLFAPRTDNHALPAFEEFLLTPSGLPVLQIFTTRFPATLHELDAALQRQADSDHAIRTWRRIEEEGAFPMAPALYRARYAREAGRAEEADAAMQRAYACLPAVMDDMATALRRMAAAMPFLAMFEETGDPLAAALFYREFRKPLCHPGQKDVTVIPYDQHTLRFFANKLEEDHQPAQAALFLELLTRQAAAPVMPPPEPAS
jgi:tetratricopeptide (TPR) repeat protein